MKGLILQSLVRAILAFGLLLWPSLPSIAGESQPQGKTKFVSVSQAFAYSGPSEDLYPTNELNQAAPVEVFHETEAGWAAIRPPKGSFSWLPASEAFLLPGGRTIEVTSNNSVSWIGTSLGTAKQYRWQVKLNSGEQLIVLGEETIKDPEGVDRLWYKIAPPNGEFRWIQSAMLSSEAPPQPPQAKPEKPTSPEVVTAVATESADNNSDQDATEVESAVYQGEVLNGQVFDGEIVEGEIIEGEIIEGSVIDEGFVDGEVYEGEIVDGEIYGGEFHDEGIIDGSIEQMPHANWNDWQLFEFTDQGLRFPLWERALARQATAHDPMLEDPFSLAMIPKVKGPRLGMIGPSDLQPEPPAFRRTPWRDPRELAQLRMQGYPQASAERGQGTTMSALRESFNSSGNGANIGSMGANIGTGGLHGPTLNGSGLNSLDAPSVPYENGYTPPANLDSLNPKPAPSMDLPPATGSTGNLGAGLQPSFMTPGNPSAQTSEGGWMSRNWFGAGSQSGTVAGSMIQSTGSALMHLQQRLNEMVTQPMMQWNFGSLKEQVQSVIQTGQSPVERGQARLLMERIQEFERLAMRSGYTLAGGSMGPSTSTPGYSGGIPASPSNVTTASFVASGSGNAAQVQQASASIHSPQAMASSSFDATGWLVPVHAAMPGQPTHAITDDAGRIVAYVTALPGVNLDRFINDPIGIRGLRGYLPQFQAAHIEAQDVVRLR